MRVKITFLKSPFAGWEQITYDDVEKTAEDGEWLALTFDGGREISFPVENIFSVEESSFEYTHTF